MRSVHGAREHMIPTIVAKASAAHQRYESGLVPRRYDRCIHHPFSCAEESLVTSNLMNAATKSGMDLHEKNMPNSNCRVEQPNVRADGSVFCLVRELVKKCWKTGPACAGPTWGA